LENVLICEIMRKMINNKEDIPEITEILLNRDIKEEKIPRTILRGQEVSRGEIAQAGD